MNTDTLKWTAVTNSDTSVWEDRSKIISHFIRPTDVVLDLGAGNQTLQKYLPRGCGYIPVDCTDALPNTFVIDFNKEFRLPNEPFNIVVAAGFLEFLTDVDGFLRRLAAQCEGKLLLFTYFYWNEQSARSLSRAERMSYMSSPEECVAVVSKHAVDVRKILEFRGQTIFSCTLASQGSSAIVTTPSITNIINRKHKSPWQRWAKRLHLSTNNDVAR